MKQRFFYLFLLLSLLIGLLPATALAQDSIDSGNEFVGLIQSLPSTPGWQGDWVVAGRTVHVGPTTYFELKHGPIQVGACVEVKGWFLGDGSLNAYKIETKEPYKCGGSGGGGYTTKFYGTIEQMPAGTFVGTWVVSGRVVNVSPTTWIKQEYGPAVVGAYVEVEGFPQADGSVNATKIEVKSGSGGGGGGYTTKFYGTIEQMPAGTFVGTWVVSGRVVNVGPTTWIEQKYGLAVVGAYVEVQGFQQADGSINATKIEVKNGSGGGGTPGNPPRGSGLNMKFKATVEAMPANGYIGDWTIGGRTVHVLPTTKLEQKKGPFRVGALVEVKGLQQADGSVNATKLEVKR